MTTFQKVLSSVLLLSDHDLFLCSFNLSQFFIYLRAGCVLCCMCMANEKSLESKEQKFTHLSFVCSVEIVQKDLYFEQ